MTDQIIAMLGTASTEQVERRTEPHPRAQTATGIAFIKRADAFVAATATTILRGGTRAFYRPSSDSIKLPPPPLV